MGRRPHAADRHAPAYSYPTARTIETRLATSSRVGGRQHREDDPEEPAASTAGHGTVPDRRRPAAGDDDHDEPDEQPRDDAEDRRRSTPSDPRLDDDRCATTWRRVMPGRAQDADLADPLDDVHGERVDDPEGGDDDGDEGERIEQAEDAVRGRLADRSLDAVERDGSSASAGLGRERSAPARTVGARRRSGRRSASAPATPKARSRRGQPTSDRLARRSREASARRSPRRSARAASDPSIADRMTSPDGGARQPRRRGPAGTIVGAARVEGGERRATGRRRRIGQPPVGERGRPRDRGRGTRRGGARLRPARSNVAIGLTRSTPRPRRASSRRPRRGRRGRIEVTTRSTRARRRRSRRRPRPGHAGPTAAERDDHGEPDRERTDRERRPAAVAHERRRGRGAPRSGPATANGTPATRASGRQDERRARAAVSEEWRVDREARPSEPDRGAEATRGAGPRPRPRRPPRRRSEPAQRRAGPAEGIDARSERLDRRDAAGAAARARRPRPA